MGHGPVTVVFGVAFVVVGLWMLGLLYGELVSRTTFLREGIVDFNGFLTRRVPWPASRSAIFPVMEVAQGRHQVKLYVQAPDGSAVWLRSFFWNTKDDTSLHDAERQIAALWAWAQSRGLVRDDGRYVPVTNPGIERKRRGAADRLEYLHALGR